MGSKALMSPLCSTSQHPEKEDASVHEVFPRGLMPEAQTTRHWQRCQGSAAEDPCSAPLHPAPHNPLKYAVAFRMAMPYSPPSLIKTEEELSRGRGSFSLWTDSQKLPLIYPTTSRIVREPYSKGVVMATKSQPRAEWSSSPHKWCFMSPISSSFSSDKRRHQEVLDSN